MLTSIKLLDDETGNIRLYPDWLANADEIFNELASSGAWQGRNIRLFGKAHPIPRLEQWIGAPGVAYRYSGHAYVAQGWPVHLAELPKRLLEQFAWQSNGALLNYYRSGQDSMGWHSDNEPELGVHPSVAILSLGQARSLLLRRIDDHRQKIKVELLGGSLLWMAGATQTYWQHSLPKRAKKAARISCTFRNIVDEI
ncbi:alpha-ketoglutarate-dependent dioxygenase AlkB family protein [Reinekea sp.]|jgi:alkylated DNA repair dioxygenase AlkB|uniref:alpha-ketoglutarate-dependent dioxygenase AlkB family protein n=1 Tax=Reinekea sp. TaxID=1970455 RepID=UPI002A81BE21|nr:alpha-ketoglutarate-dependent dioxygenase AlkB [Reinekea sp.]